MVKSFSTRVLEDTVALLLENQRDIKNPSLRPYYTATVLGESQAEERYNESVIFREASGLPNISASRFANDLSQSTGPALFSEYLAYGGIESLFAEDLVSTQNVNPIRDTSVSSFLSKQRMLGSLGDAAVTKLLSRVSSASLSVLHLLEETPRLFADDVDEINDRLSRMQNYIRRLYK